MKKANSDKKRKNQAVQRQYGSQWSGWLVIITAAAGLGICLYLYSLHVALVMG
jgi:hypothetical protein